MTTRLRIVLVLSAVAVVGGCASRPWREEPAQRKVRPYAQLRVGQATYADPTGGGLEMESPSAEPPGGLSLGADLGRRWSAELAIDTVETALNDPRTGQRVIENSVWTVLGQAKVRYPLCRGRLVPYAVAGCGLGVASFNDADLDAPFAASGTIASPVGVVGAGVDWFVQDNVALGIQARYLVGLGGDFEIDGQDRTLSLDALYLQASMTVYPDCGAGEVLCPGRLCCDPPARDNGCLRGYLQLRAGLTTYLDPDALQGLSVESPSEAFGASLGVNLNRYVGIEVAGEYGETALRSAGGVAAEYSLWTILGQVRLRYPLLRGRLVPYVVGGAGIGYGEVNDTKPAGVPLGLGLDRDSGLVYSAGVGIEYFLDHNLAIGVEAKYVFGYDRAVELASGTRDLSVAPLFITAGLRVFFP